MTSLLFSTLLTATSNKPICRQDVGVHVGITRVLPTEYTRRTHSAWARHASPAHTRTPRTWASTHKLAIRFTRQGCSLAPQGFPTPPSPPLPECRGEGPRSWPPRAREDSGASHHRPGWTRSPCSRPAPSGGAWVLQARGGPSSMTRVSTRGWQLRLQPRSLRQEG